MFVLSNEKTDDDLLMCHEAIVLAPHDFERVLQILEDGILWESIEWSPSAVWIRGKEHPLTRVQFMSRIVPVGS